MTTIYCDASCDIKQGLYAWACIVISQKGKTIVYTGQINPHTTDYCELLAVIKALGKVKSYRGQILLYTDLKSIVDDLKNPNKKRRKTLRKYGEWTTFCNYFKRYKNKLSVQYIPRNQNFAHIYAKAALNRLRDNKPLELLVKLDNTVIKKDTTSPSPQILEDKL